MDINRKVAYLTLMDVETKKSFSNLALNHHIKVHNPGSPAFIRELTYGVLENKMLLDHYIDQLVKTGAASLKAGDRTLLRMGIYQLGFMDSVPEYAAVNESVVMAKKYCRGRSGFINGVLRGYLSKKDQLTLPDPAEDMVRYLSVKYSYEPWIVELWLEEYDAEFVEELLAAGNETPENTIRFNWMKTRKQDLIEKLEERGFQVEEGRICQNALYVKGSGLLETGLYADGFFSVQDESSMLVSEKLAPEHGETILDMCAAPGGKTMAIAERMNNTGRIIASDIYRRKLDLIDREAYRLGIKNVETRAWDATRLDTSMVGKADRVLVDAPCSGLGVVRRKPEIKYKEKTQEMDLLPRTQLKILTNAAKYVKVGGTLVYSTCTINPYENQRVVDDFLKKNNMYEVEEMIQLLPNKDGTDGFFICVMKNAGVLI